MHAVVYVFVTDIACTLMMMHAVVVSTSLMSLECPVVYLVRHRRYHSLLVTSSCPSGPMLLSTSAASSHSSALCRNLPQKGLRPKRGELIWSFSWIVFPPFQNWKPPIGAFWAALNWYCSEFWSTSGAIALSSSSVPKYRSIMSNAFWYISRFSWLCKNSILSKPEKNQGQLT